MTRSINAEHLTESIANAFQLISYAHPPDYIRSLSAAYDREESPTAKAAIAQILVNSHMSFTGKRPICQDTGITNVFIKLGIDARLTGASRGLQPLVDEGVRRAYQNSANPLRASIVDSPLFERHNTRDNTPAVVHTEIVPGDLITVTCVAKGGGSENKSRFTVLNPSDSVSDWVVDTVSTLGAGWCPPGVLGIGVGGTAEKAMLLAKESLIEPLNMADLLRDGPASRTDELRMEIYHRINSMGIGAQGLGGLTTVLDVKIRSYPTHAAALPVGLIPNCAANRHITFTLDGSGTAQLEPSRVQDWPEIVLSETKHAVRSVHMDTLTRADVASWRIGETLLLSGKMLTARDAAHKRLVSLLESGSPLPVNLRDRVLYYVGPVDPAPGEVVGPAGPTTSTRMDPFTETLLQHTGLLAMVGKAERGPDTVQSIAHHGAAYMIAVGGAAYLVSKAIKASRVVAFEELGMEAIFEFEVEDMPVIVACDVTGKSLHEEGPKNWTRPVQWLSPTTTKDSSRSIAVRRQNTIQ
jgi:fumarate hydratase, class I